MKLKIVLVCTIVPFLFNCKKMVEEEPMEMEVELSEDKQAIAQSVEVSGTEGNYTFSVNLKSPDLGCDQYADWWEVISLDEQLLYRRILGHSHVNEQPFTRSGGPVNINEDEEVYVRGHMNNLSYGSIVLKGTVANGFVKDTLAADFAKGLETAEPLPTNCAF